jgi:hypothetical protein
MKTNYLAGIYYLTKLNGEKITITLTKAEAKMLFKLFQQLGFNEITHKNYE